MKAFDRALLRFNRWAIIAVLAAMAVIVFANVALRFLTDASILWAEEVSRYLMIWLAFLGAGPVLRYGGHIGIDTLQESFPRAAPALRTIVFALLLGFFVFMVWIGIRYASRTWAQTTPITEVPIGFVYLAMPIGFGLLIVHLLLMARGWIGNGEFLKDEEFDPEAAKL